MRIGIIGHLKFPIAKPYAGGLESFTHGFVQSLIARGHQVTLFASEDSDATLPLVPIIQAGTILDSKRRLGRIHHEWIESVEDEAYESLMVRLTSGQFDVIHNHSLNPIPLRFASVLPTRMITTLHAPVLPRMASELRQRGSETCGNFVNISRSNASSWEGLVSDQTVIYNGVDTEFWKRAQTTKVRRAIWFGRILPDKGTHLAIQAAHLAKLPIDLVGPICDQDYFNECVAPLLLPDDQYHGHQTHESLCSLISRAGVCLVTPCWDEPFGLVVTESLACGTPVAGFARGALPELLLPSVGRLAPPNNVHALAKATNQCLTLSGEVCRRFAQEKFSFGRMIDQYEVLYLGNALGAVA